LALGGGVDDQPAAVGPAAGAARPAVTPLPRDPDVARGVELAAVAAPAPPAGVAALGMIAGQTDAPDAERGVRELDAAPGGRAAAPEAPPGRPPAPPPPPRLPGVRPLGPPPAGGPCAADGVVVLDQAAEVGPVVRRVRLRAERQGAAGHVDAAPVGVAAGAA